MLGAVTLPLFILFFTFIIHYRQHFRFTCCHRVKSSVSTISVPSQRSQIVRRNAISNDNLPGDGILATKQSFRRKKDFDVVD